MRCASLSAIMRIAQVLVMDISLAAALPPELRLTDAGVFAAMDLTRPELQQVCRAVEADDLPAASQAWADYLRQRPAPVLHFNRDTWAGVIRRDLPQLAGPIIAMADGLARHEISGATCSLPVKDGLIDWSHNPTRDTNYIEMVGTYVALTSLGRAYLLTRDEKYVQAFVWYFDSWFDHREEIETHQGNLGFSPLYQAYYPGIRARLLLDNLYCLAASPHLTPQIHMKLLRELLGCARWIHNHNAAYQVGNQQVAAALGAAAVGLFCPEFRESAAWTSRAVARMAEHLREDFHPDGGHRELCDQYHVTVLRDIGYIGMTQARNGQTGLLEGETGRLYERAVAWLAALVMPTGETPPLHSGVYATEWVIPLTVGAKYCQRADFWALARPRWNHYLVPSQKGPLALTVWMVNEDFSREALASLQPTPPAYRNIHLASSGFAVMRTGWEPEDRYLIFQYGWGNTGHAYPGALSYSLMMNQEVIATNPGSPRSYHHPAYGYCHSTPSHNVVSIDGKSYVGANHIAPGGELVTLAEPEGAWYVHARHEGYQPELGATHERRMLVIHDGPIVWWDRLTGGDGHVARWHFHTPLTVTMEGKAARLQGRGSYVLAPLDPEHLAAVEQETHWMAVLPRDCQPQDCGREIPALAWVKPITGAGADFVMALCESATGAGSVTRGDDGLIEVHTPEAEYVISFGPSGSARLSSDGECACVRYVDGRPVEAWLIGGTRLRLAGVEEEVALPEPGSVHRRFR
jgi:hypothetical protein